MEELSELELVECSISIQKLIRHYKRLADKAVEKDCKSDEEMYLEYYTNLETIKCDVNDTLHERLGVCYV